MTYQITRRHLRRAARFPNRIREYRLKAGLSQARLAKLLGRHPDTISDWERGKALPSVPVLFRMAKTLATLAEALYIDYYITRPDEGGRVHTPEA